MAREPYYVVVTYGPYTDDDIRIGALRAYNDMTTSEGPMVGITDEDGREFDIVDVAEWADELIIPEANES